MRKLQQEQQTSAEEAALPLIAEQKIARRSLHEVTAAEQVSTAQGLLKRRLPPVREVRKRAASRKFLDALIGPPGAQEQFAELIPDWLRLMNAGLNPLQALEAASEDQGPALRSLCRQAVERAGNGWALSDALAGSTAQMQLPAIIPAVLRHWERQGMPSETLRRLAVECRRLAQRERNLAYSVCSPQLARREPLLLRKAAQRVNASRGGIARRSLATMRWADVFIGCWRCGLSISEALDVAAESAQNAYYSHVLKEAAHKTRQGFPLSVCLAETQLLPLRLIDQLRTGEQTGNLDESLEFFAGIMEGDAKDLGAQSLFMRRILPFIILFSAGIVFLFGMLGGIKLAVTVTTLFLIVSFVAWEFIFRQSIAGDPELGVGKSDTRMGKQSPDQEAEQGDPFDSSRYS